jgi:TrmH family RNA methyltransferase
MPDMISKSQGKYIQSLGQKKHRDEFGVFIAEGPKLVKELLQQTNVIAEQVFAIEEWVNENKKLLAQADVVAITEKELERISRLRTPNQVVAIIKKFPVEKPIVKGKISLVLDTIQDPGNLGTIIRTADWFGIEQIICSEDCADIYNPKVVQATMGSIARVKVFYTDLLSWLPEQKEMRIYATMLEGKDISKMGALTEGLILIGNESKGISDELLQFANERITIGKKGKAESMNAAVATAIVLSHLI